MGRYGEASRAVEYVIRRAGELTIDEAAAIYHARGARLLRDGTEADRRTRLKAERIAARTGRLARYLQARHAAVAAWRRALPAPEGPWLMIGVAIGNAAGALVLEDVLDEADFRRLVGPWQQAIETLVPVGPGQRVRKPSETLSR